MANGILDSPRTYFVAAVVLLAAAVASQFEVDVPSRDVAPIDELATLPERDDLNVVFLLVDTLRADRLGVYGYERPTSTIIDDAANYGVVFEDTVAQSSWTKTSMASLWTGTHPVNNGILRYNHGLPESAVMPAELFREAGYRTVGLWRNGWVEPNFGFAQGFETYFKPTPGAARARMHRQSPGHAGLTGTDEDMTIAAVDFLDQFGEERFFLYMHYMDIHQYIYDEAAAIFGTSYSDVYDQSIHWTDRLVGVLLQKLEDLDLLNRTLVVIAADHGEAFLEHGREGHARDLYDEVTRVPFIIVLPFLLDPGVRVETTVSNVDIWPTILDIVGLPPLPGADGRSLLPMILKAGGAADPGEVDELERPVFAQIARGWGNPKHEDLSLISVTYQDQRYIAMLEDQQQPELYDRAEDPGEKRNLLTDDPDAAQALRVLVDTYRSDAELPWGEAPSEVELDEMRLNHLRALGYVIKQ